MTDHDEPQPAGGSGLLSADGGESATSRGFRFRRATPAHRATRAQSARNAARPTGGGRGHRPALWATAALAIAVVALGALTAVQLARPYAAPKITGALAGTHVVAGTRPVLPWPASGEAEVDVQGIGMLGALHATTPVPIASLTKMMTALIVLTDHPLAPLAAPGSGGGAPSDGPVLTVSRTDVTTAFFEALGGQSVARVAAGETLTERQALEALLVPSANNIAAILAVWDAGSVSAFVAKMNAQAQALHMTGTHYADVSGVDPATVSDAHDLVLLAEQAMANPTFAQIVAEPQVVLPVAGLVYNDNALVGHDQFIGVKTGYTSQAGGCFTFVTTLTVGGRLLHIVGVVLGQRGRSDLDTALHAGQLLADAAARTVREITAVPAGEVVASVVLASGQRIPVTVRAPARLLAWPGLRLQVHASISLGPHGSPPPAGARLAAGPLPGNGDPTGDLTVTVGTQRVSVAVATARPVGSPSLLWRLTRP